jgi:CelD/BcsL family acetyltransferase involved in cellulose biosynthesis
MRILRAWSGPCGTGRRQAARVTLEVHERVDSLVDEWDALADRTGAAPWFRPGYFRVWWKAFGRGGLEIVAARREGQLVGVIPLARIGTQLVSPTNWETPEYGCLAADEAARQELARGAFDRRPQRLTLGILSREDVQACCAAARGARYLHVTRTLLRSPYLDLRGDLDNYLATRGPAKKRLKELERRRRRLREQGKLAVEVEEGRERLDELLAEGLPLEGSGWKERSGTAILSQPNMRRFYTELAQWAAARGILRLFFIRLDRRPIAFVFTIDDGRALYHLKGGYDVAFRAQAPGVLAVAEMVSYAFSRSLKTLEFLGEEEPFKLEWTTTVRERMLFRAFRLSPLGVIAWTARAAVYTLGIPIARHVRALRR